MMQQARGRLVESETAVTRLFSGEYVCVQAAFLLVPSGGSADPLDSGRK